MVLQFMQRKDFLCRSLFMFLTGFNSFTFLLLFPLLIFFFVLCTVFDAISYNIDEGLSMNPSANVSFFGDFNIHLKDWLTYSGGTDRPGELCYNFSFSDYLTRMVSFPTRILMTVTVLLFWISFFLLLLVFVLQWLSLHWEILIMLLS